MDFKTLERELPPAPADVVDWIRKSCVNKTYIFYFRNERKAVCSRCGKIYSLDACGYCKDLKTTLNHNDEITCRACKKKAIAKAGGRGRRGLDEFFRVFLFVRKGNNLYASLSEVIVSFDEAVPNISRFIVALYKFNQNERVYYFHRPGYYPGYHGEYCYRWEDRSGNIKVPTPYTAMGVTKFWATYTYQKNFRSAFNIPALKYADVVDISKKYDLSVYGLISYIDLSIRYQSLELLRKAGFEQLFKEKILGRGPSRACNWKAKSIEKILRVKTKGEAKEIKAENLSLSDLLVYQRYSSDDRKCPVRLIPILSDLPTYSAYPLGSLNDRRSVIGRNIDIIAAAEYVYKQRSLCKKKDRLVTIGDYADYLLECEKLSYDLTEKQTLKPKRLMEAHKKTSGRVRDLKEQIDAAEFTKNTLKITGMTEPYVEGDYMIRPAASAAELREEGQSLGHCVGGYANGVCVGSRAILFIRKTSKPKKSFYTLELSAQGNVIQCRGKGNRNMTEEVKIFVELWVSEVINKKKKAAKKEKAA